MSVLSSNILNSLYQIGTDPKAVTLAKNTASLVIKPPMIMLDNTADPETKNHAALWEFSDRAIAIALQLSVFPLLPLIGKGIAKNVFKYNNNKAIKGTIKFTEFALGTVFLNTILVPFYNSKYLTQIINNVSEKLTGKKLMPKQEEDEERRTKEFNEKLEQFINKVTDKNTENSDTSNSTKSIRGQFFKAANDFLSFITSPKKAMDKALAAFGANIYKDLSNTDDYNSIQGEQSLKDKFYKGTKVLTNLLIGGVVLGALSKKFGVKAGKYLEGFMKNESKVSAKQNLLRLLLAEAMAKPVLILMNGDPYMAMRKFFDKIVGISIILATNKPIKDFAKQFGKAKGLTKPERKGLKTALILGIQVCLLLNVLVTLINNKVVGNIFKKYFNDKEESYQKDFRSRIPLIKLTQNEGYKPNFTNISSYNNYQQHNPFTQFVNFTQSSKTQKFSSLA